MNISRLPLLPMLIAIAVVPAAAQSANPAQIAPASPPLFSQLPLIFSQPRLSATVPSWDGRTQIPLPVPNAKAGAAGSRSLPTQDWNGPRRFSVTPNLLRRFQLLQPQSPPVLLSRNLVINDERCYAMREYQFNQESPASDATALTGSSTCAPSTKFHLKGATLAR